MKPNNLGDINERKQNKLPCFIDSWYRKKDLITILG
jgi:hypothetical protein